MDGANYKVCKFVESRLKPNERYLSFLSLRFFCPLAAAQGPYFGVDDRFWLHSDPLVPPRDTLVKEFLKANFRLIVTQIRRTEQCVAQRNCRPSVPENSPIARIIKPVLARLKPIFTGPTAAVYDGEAVAAALRQ